MSLLRKYLILATVSGVLVTTGCKSGVDPVLGAKLGLAAIQAVTISDAQVRDYAELVCQQYDAKSKILPSNSAEVVRINRIANSLDSQLAGQKVNYKVYQADKFNAFALPNGCIRINSAMLDKFTDNEIAAVLGHEMGHVALKHSASQLRTISLLQVALQAGGIYSKADLVAHPLFQNLVLQFTNAQFSQQHELQADQYSIEMLRRHGIDPNAVITLLEKLEKSYGSNSPGLLSYFQSHPSNAVRIKNAQKLIGERSSTPVLNQRVTNNKTKPNVIVRTEEIVN